jgi:hypothetical protein
MWAHTDLSVAANSAHLRAAGNPAGYTLGNSQHVVCRGSDGHIHEFYWQGGSWAHNDLTEASNSTHLLAASDPSCYTLGDSQHVIYRGVDGHIHELYWEGRQWAHHDLTVASNSVHVPAASDPAGYTLGKSQHAVYRGADGRIHELYWQGGSKWTHHDLTAASNSGHLSAVGDPAAYTLGESQHVIFRANDGHIHELYWQPGTTWVHSDLTAAAKSPALAAGDPAAYILGGSQHVVYRGNDKHIHELYWQPGTTWAHNDLTADSESPVLAAGDPAGYTLGNTQHVIYCAVDGHIYELDWEGGRWRQHNLTLEALNNPTVPINSHVFDEYDIVVSITEKTINRQLTRLVEMGAIKQDLVLSQSIDKNGNYVYRELNSSEEIPRDAQGTPIGACLAGAILPQIKISQSGTNVTFILNFQSGAAYFWVLDSPPRLQKYDITGWKYGLSIALDLKAIERDDIGKKIKVPRLVEQQLTQFLERDFEISHLFLDFDSVDLLRFDPISTNTKDAGERGNQQLAQFMQSYLVNLIKQGNPLVLGYSVTTTPNTKIQANRNVPDTLKPTGTTFITYHDPQYPELSTLNFVLVTKGGHGRIGGSPGNFNGNWIKPDDKCDGKIIYSHTCFYEALLLRPLFDKIRTGIWNRVRAHVSVPQGNNYVAAKQVTPNNWVFNISNITRGDNQYANSFSVVVDNQPDSVRFHFKGHVYAYKEVSKDCFFCTARAHASGIIDWSGQITAGTSKDPDGSAVIKLDDGFRIDHYSTPHGTNSCADAFDWIGTMLGAIVDTFTAFRDDGFFLKLFSNTLGVNIPGIGNLNVALENAATNARSVVLLPSGDLFDFKNPASDYAGNLSLQLTYKESGKPALAGTP